MNRTRPKEKQLVSLALALTVLLPTALTCAVGCEERRRPSPIAEALESHDWEPIPWYQDLDFTQLKPGSHVDYWQLREGLVGSQRSKVLAEGGEQSRSEIPSHHLADLDTVTTPLGFASMCELSCEMFVVTLEDGQVRVISAVSDLKGLLRPIDSATEAIMIALAEGYWNGPELVNGAVRQGAAGFDLIMLKLVSACRPVHVERLLLRIGSQGEVVEVDSENETFDEDGCIIL